MHRNCFVSCRRSNGSNGGADNNNNHSAAATGVQDKKDKTKNDTLSRG